ncbi:hypothetical protein AZI86_07195 [Bdellovibrio bacteriovorus]|uniref:Transcription regulator PadR N-terminal domain-containing protein n=1 Tax=Bdellovibrio bacteriovorus TaxID=959 RepID=A0A150WR13_BDEBC|nr:helix-turn-helix transcriptional regulator [Bdellovibrio bacteriovorus]KYG66816.1 hypothetical protein AZI86_07195 [Bdellovibrio bacteriovorus]
MEEQIYLGDLEKYILTSIMRRANDAYGVEIRAGINKASGKEYSVATIYKTLDRLEAKGFVTSRKGEATEERGGRAKMYFQVTGLGEKALSQSYRALERIGFLDLVPSLKKIIIRWIEVG